jgi:hypothetical protein
VELQLSCAGAAEVHYHRLPPAVCPIPDSARVEVSSF